MRAVVAALARARPERSSAIIGCLQRACIAAATSLQGNIEPLCCPVYSMHPGISSNKSLISGRAPIWVPALHACCAAVERARLVIRRSSETGTCCRVALAEFFLPPSFQGVFRCLAGTCPVIALSFEVGTSVLYVHRPALGASSLLSMRLRATHNSTLAR